MVTLFGNNLAPGMASAATLPLPTMQGLDGVTVLVNGTNAPINYVSPTEILINVPYEAILSCPQTGSLSDTSCFAQFVVDNNGTQSNPVTMVLNATTPGVFTADYGLGYGYVQHSADYSLVTPSSPAQPGETVIAYLSGLGSVSPNVADGAAAPANVQTANTIGADIGGVAATVIFAGLTPTLSGLYQIDLTLPSTGLTAGDNTIDISGPDSYTTQALVSIGSGTAASDRKPSAKVRRRPKTHANASRKAFCFPSRGKTCKAE